LTSLPRRVGIPHYFEIRCRRALKDKSTFTILASTSFFRALPRGLRDGMRIQESFDDLFG